MTNIERLKEDHQKGYWDEYEKAFKQEAYLLLKKYFYPNHLICQTQLDLINEMIEETDLKGNKQSDLDRRNYENGDATGTLGYGYGQG